MFLQDAGFEHLTFNPEVFHALMYYLDILTGITKNFIEDERVNDQVSKGSQTNMDISLKNPFIIICATISFAVLFVANPGSTAPSQTFELEAAFSVPEILMGENSTLITKITNHAPTPSVFILHIIYTNQNFQFYDPLTGDRLDNIKAHDQSYTLIHPTGGILDRSTTIPITIVGPTPKGASETFRITVKIFTLQDSEQIEVDQEAVMLTVNYA
jgi:hypothetical protein